MLRKDNQKFKASKSENHYSAFSVDNGRNIATEIKDEEGWILDSRASAHMTSLASQKHLFVILEGTEELNWVMELNYQLKEFVKFK